VIEIFKAKPVSDTRWESVDFIGRVAPTETLRVANVAVTCESGVDFKPEAMLYGPVAIDGTVVSQMVTGGEVGNIYILHFAVDTSVGQNLVARGYLVVVPDVIGAASQPVHLPSGF